MPSAPQLSLCRAMENLDSTREFRAILLGSVSVFLVGYYTACIVSETVVAQLRL